MQGDQESRFDSRLEAIRAHVCAKWHRSTGPPWYIFHDDSHSKTVEAVIDELIPENRRDLLHPEEQFYLKCSAWLHDLGMILDLFGPEVEFAQARDTHHERSAEYVRTRRKDLDLDPTEAHIIGELCRYHRRKKDIADCEATIGRVRPRLLAAYLRLADALHVDRTRTDESLYRLLLAAGMPWESRFHWLKSRWVHSVVPEHESLTIRVSVSDAPPGSSKCGLLPRLVVDEIREELESVRDILIRGGISYFLDVIPEPIPGPLNEQDTMELELVLSNIELQNLSSAGEVADSVAETLLKFSDSGPEAYAAIREYKQRLRNLLAARPCHNLLRTILERIDRETKEDHLPEEARSAQVQQIRSFLLSLRDRRERSIRAIAQNARPLLSDGGAVLVYGYSSLVIAALRQLSAEAKDTTTLYVAECRGKTRYSYANAVVYCDGLAYAMQIRDAGIRHAVIVPDISVANLMARAIVKKVVFGANGIDADGRFGHTCGHLGIAQLAQAYGIPVYVIAETDKFRKLEWHGDLERDVQWLSRDPRTVALLEIHGIGTMNPREDVVDPRHATMLVTEVGTFPPTRIPESVIDRM